MVNKKQLIIILLIIATIIIIGFFMMQPKKSGTIILMNGTSSSGKSTILKEIHKQSPDFVILKVDDFWIQELTQKAQELGWDKEINNDPWLYLHQYLSKKTGKPYFDAELREQLFTEISPFNIAAKNAARAGKTVVMDTVLEYESAFQQAFDYFKNEQVIMVLVYCPLDLLLERVKQRNASGVSHETRTAFLSFEQFPAIYKVQEKNDEPIIDTVKTKAIKDALEAAIQELIDQHIPEEYVPKLEQFKKDFIKQFKLDEREEINLVPRHHYDILFKNDASANPQEIAQQIKKLIKA